MHAVLPTRPGRARVLFRISTDFVVLPELAGSIGGQVWANLAEMVLHEQLEHVRPAGGGGGERGGGGELRGVDAGGVSQLIR